MNEEQIETLARTSESSKSAHHRIDKLESEMLIIHKLAISIEKIAQETKSTRQDVNSMKKEMAEIKEKPARRWENITEKIMTVIVTAIVVYFLAKFGL